MDLVFTKGAGKSDTLDLFADGRRSRIDCPKQRIIPQDMVHYAVEHVLAARGFLSRVADGEAADFAMAGAPTSDGVERLVEVFQGDGWSGGATPADAMIDLYNVTCAARSCSPLDVDALAIEAVRYLIHDLSARWEAIPVGGTLALRL